MSREKGQGRDRSAQRARDRERKERNRKEFSGNRNNVRMASEDATAEKSVAVAGSSVQVKTSFQRPGAVAVIDSGQLETVTTA